MGEGVSQRKGLDGLGAEFGGSAKLVHYGVQGIRSEPFGYEVVGLSPSARNCHRTYEPRNA